MQVKCNFLKVNKLNTNPPKATFYCKLQCFLHLRTCLKTPQKSANQNLELSPPPPPELPPGQQLKAIFIAFRHQLGPPHPPPSLSVILPSATALSVIRRGAGYLLDPAGDTKHQDRTCILRTSGGLSRVLSFKVSVSGPLSHYHPSMGPCQPGALARLYVY